MTTSSQTTPARTRKRARLLLLLILGITFGLYLRALGGEFVYDDELLIERNPAITTLSDPIGLMTSPYWDFLDPDNADQIGYWRPLTALCNAVSWAIGNGATWAFHLVGILAHLGATAMAFLLVRRLTPGLFVAGTAALVFGVHPAHVESVAWISALNDPLFGFFGLLAVERFLAWRQNDSRGVPWASALAMCFALASKELGAAVLPLCIAIDLAGRERRALVRAYAPFLGVVCLYILARVAVFDSWGAGFERETTSFQVSSWRLGLLRVELLGGALELLALPIDLKLFRPFIPDLTLGSAQILRALAWILGALGVGVFAFRRRSAAALFALLLIPAALSPALLKVNSLGSFPLADRFLYVPVLGAGILLGLALQALAQRRLALGLVVLAASLLGAKTLSRIDTWSDNITLYETAGKETPRSAYVLWGLGRVQLERFRDTLHPLDLEAAFISFETAGELLAEANQGATDLYVTERDVLQVNLGLGWAWIYKAQYDNSESFSTAVTILEILVQRMEEIENEAAAARQRGLRVIGGNLELEQAYVALGSAYLGAGRKSEGKDRLERALRLNSNYPPASFNLGAMYFADQEYALAERAFEQVVAQVPRHVEARVFLARCALEQNEVETALEMALELANEGVGGAEPLVLQATVALRDGDVSGALGHLDRALELDPNHGYAWFHRGNAFYLQGKGSEALSAFRRAADLLPREFDVNYNFGAFLLGSGGVE
ncbi:MAG: tetratricopeptide (TPR) repeat protein, partial [Planctomycetota bacterium]